MKLSKDVQKLLNILINSGFDTYVVGGCVRDNIMNKQQGDIDITTSALPQQTKEILSKHNIKTIDTGIKHGTVTAIYNDENYEITTFRTDGNYLDSRHPNTVNFVNNINEDLSRRDFTINAIAYNDNKGYVDLFYGKQDIQNKIIKTVGSPDKRFKEDALRIMRALRFSSTLGFTIDDYTKKAMFDNKELLLNVSGERIFAELSKLLLGKNAKNVLIEFKEIIAVILPPLTATFNQPQNTKWHKYDVFTHIVNTVSNSKPTVKIRLTMLLHDIGKPYCRTKDEYGIDHFKGHSIVSEKLAKNALKPFHISNDLYNDIITLVRIHDKKYINSKPSIKHLLNEYGVNLFNDFLDVKIADAKGKNLIYVQKDLDYINETKIILEEIIKNNEPYKISQLNINGNDLMKIGICGKNIGQALSELLNVVIENPVNNNYDYLIEYAMKNKSN